MSYDQMRGTLPGQCLQWRLVTANALSLEKARNLLRHGILTCGTLIKNCDSYVVPMRVINDIDQLFVDRVIQLCDCISTSREHALGTILGDCPSDMRFYNVVMPNTPNGSTQDHLRAALEDQFLFSAVHVTPLCPPDCVLLIGACNDAGVLLSKENGEVGLALHSNAVAVLKLHENRYQTLWDAVMEAWC